MLKDIRVLFWIIVLVVAGMGALQIHENYKNDVAPRLEKTVAVAPVVVEPDTIGPGWVVNHFVPQAKPVTVKPRVKAKPPVVVPPSTWVDPKSGIVYNIKQLEDRCVNNKWNIFQGAICKRFANR